MRVCIIDSGINISHKFINPDKIKDIYIMDNNGYIVHSEIKDCDLLGHGTAISYIITSQKCEVIGFKVFDNDLECNDLRLISVLRYIYENVECDIINMSLGTLINSHDLYEVCLKLHEKGVIIVSAYNNNGAVSYPAYYPFVIGVDTSPQCKHVDDYIFIQNNNHINVMAYGNLQRLPWINPEYAMLQGTSYAAARMTSIIIKLLNQEEVKKENILEYLNKTSPKYIFCNKPDSIINSVMEIKEAIVFPYSKETDCLLNNSELLNFNLSAIYSHRKLGKINTNASRNPIDEDKYVIKNYENINWDDTFDTLILGHLNELEAMTDENIKEFIINRCIEKGKNIYSFDNIDEYKNIYDKKISVFSPPKLESYENIMMGKLHYIKSPVLGVFGTSSKQGKFTLQLKLRKLFMESGYKVGQLGTEPSALLLGMNEVYANGYETSTKLRNAETVSYVNHLVYNIDKTDPDIIIVGSQSGTIPYSNFNLSAIPTEGIPYLFAVNPDKIILCINPFDELWYINNTISSIESLANCEVIAVVLFPFDFKNEWAKSISRKTLMSSDDTENSKHYFESNLNKKCYISGNKEDESLLFELIVDSFAEENNR